MRHQVADAAQGQLRGGRRSRRGCCRPLGVGRVEDQSAAVLDGEVVEQQSLGAALVKLGRRLMEERVDVKGHLELLEAEVRRVGLQECGCHALVHLLLLRLRGPVLSGICLFVLLLFALPVALAAAVQAAHQLERLRVDRVDAVRINLDPRFEGTRGPLKVGDLLPTIARRLVDVAAHVVDQVQRPRVLLIYFLLTRHGQRSEAAGQRRAGVSSAHSPCTS